MTDDRSRAEITAADYSPPAATVSSLKSDHSTEQLICKTPQVKKVKKHESVTSKSVEAGSEGVAGGRRVVVWLGLAQVVLGALLVGAGGVAVVKGAALARVGAGLWAGCVAVVAGVVGVLAGINDCYGLNGGANGSSPLLTAFLALSLLSLACGNSAAVLAATGLQRDAQRAQPPLNTFDDEMQAWTPVLTNIAVLIISCAHCVVSAVSVYLVSRRACACLRPRRAFDHNQFEPALKPYVLHVDERGAGGGGGRELCKELEGKLQGEGLKKKKKEDPAVVEFGSANSKEKLVTRWLHHAPAPAQRGARPRGGKVRKGRQQPLVLLQPHPASTLGRPPPCMVVPAPRYATLPLPPAPYPPPPMYYPVHDPVCTYHYDSCHSCPPCIVEPAPRYATLPLPPAPYPPPTMYYPVHDPVCTYHYDSCHSCPPCMVEPAPWYATLPLPPAPYPPPPMYYPVHDPVCTYHYDSCHSCPPCMVEPAPRYATMPLPPAQYPPPMYYPVYDPRIRRRRSPRDPRVRRRDGRPRDRERDSQLTRSLERIHRKRRAERERLSDAELKRTYTGLDRTYAEQFIAVIDETRHAAEHHDSLASTSATSDTSHTS